MRLALFVAAIVIAGILVCEFGPAAPYESEHVQNLSAGEVESRVLDAPADQVWVLDFWAPWCGPCRRFGPEFAATADLLFSRASFGKINLDETPEMGPAFGVQAIPTVMVVRGGQVVQRTTGGMSRGELKEWLGPVLQP